MDTDVKVFITIDGNPTNNVVAFCRYQKHRGYLTPKLMKTHGCLARKCPKLRKLECQFWEDRRSKKEMKRLAKRQLEERKL